MGHVFRRHNSTTTPRLMYRVFSFKTTLPWWHGALAERAPGAVTPRLFPCQPPRGPVPSPSGLCHLHCWAPASQRGRRGWMGGHAHRRGAAVSTQLILKGNDTAALKPPTHTGDDPSLSQEGSTMNTGTRGRLPRTGVSKGTGPAWEAVPGLVTSPQVGFLVSGRHSRGGGPRPPASPGRGGGFTPRPQPSWPIAASTH